MTARISQAGDIAVGTREPAPNALHIRVSFGTSKDINGISREGYEKLAGVFTYTTAFVEVIIASLAVGLGVSSHRLRNLGGWSREGEGGGEHCDQSCELHLE